MRSLAALAAVLGISCAGEGGTATPDAPATPVDGPSTTWAPPQNRPYDVYVPGGLPANQAAPMLVVLHGYGLDAAWETDYLRLRSVADRAGLVLVMPNGVPDASGKRFWNGTDCCVIDGTKADDVAYLAAVIAQVKQRFVIDSARVYVIGHSSGAFMAHRLACERGELLAGFVSLAGGQWLDAAKCPAGAAVSMLEIHGTADAVVWYGGSATYPGALETADRWIGRNGCAEALAVTGALDLVAALPGDETTVARSANCDEGTVVELWSILGGSHIPTLIDAAWEDALLDFLARA